MCVCYPTQEAEAKMLFRIRGGYKVASPGAFP